jgi:ferredoxin-NADP reductase
MFTQTNGSPAVAPTSAPARSPIPRRLARRVIGSSLVEALAAPHGVDRYLELVRPGWSLHDLRATVVGVRRQSSDSVTLTLRPNDVWLGFAAGQFVTLTVAIDGVRRSRCYSPACSAHATDGCLELTVKAHAEGVVSNYLNANARPGMVVELAQADGDFVLPEVRPERLLLISGGSGITPVISMLRTLCDEGHDAQVTFLHYAPRPCDALYRAELAELARRHANVRVVHAYTRADGGQLRGHFSREQLAGVDPDHLFSEAYVCGPPGLIEGVRAAWRRGGREDAVHSESYLPPAFAPSTDAVGGNVRFLGSSREASNSGRTLLEQAEAAGLQPEFGCRMGICHSCTCRKVAGHVRNVRTGELSSAEAQDIQICVSVPAGDVELDL